jgi:methyl-accepting chemotaxis protein
MREIPAMAWNSQTIMMAFVAVTGIAVLLQAFVMVGILLAVKKTAKQSLELAEDLRATIVPLAQQSRELLERVGPQAIEVCTNLVHVTRDLKDETADLRETTAELRERVVRQVARVDGMVTTSLDKVEQVTTMVEAAVTTPVRQVNGIVQGVKAAVERYFMGNPKAVETHSVGDRDMFV